LRHQASASHHRLQERVRLGLRRIFAGRGRTARPLEVKMPRNVAVGLGLMEFPFAGSGGFWRWVDLCEAGGVDSLWQTDRLVSREPILECMSVMAALAGRTRRIKFGVNVLSLAFRDPVLLAKQCATIDVLSEGRLLPAFGIGSPLGPEWRTLNLDTRTRGRRTDEGLEIIGRLWREDSVDFAGVHFHLSGASISPKPVQPDLPMWIGGSSEAAIRRTARFGTGWQAGGETPEEAAPVVARIGAEALALGRTIDDDHYGAGIPFRFGRADDPSLVPLFTAYRRRTGRDPAKHFAIGDAEAIVERIALYVAAGVSKFILRPAARGDDEMLAQTRRLVEEVLPRVALRWPKRVGHPAPARAAGGAA
jgi:probable F420-dependent oxidoreductase